MTWHDAESRRVAKVARASIIAAGAMVCEGSCAPQKMRRGGGSNINSWKLSSVGVLCRYTD